MDPIERYLGLSEKALLSEAVTILKKLNSAGRNATSDPEFRQNGWLRDVDAFQKRLGEFRAKLRQIYDPVPVENE